MEKFQYTITKEEACKIISLIYNTIEIESDNCIDEKAFISLINYLSKEKVNIYCGSNYEKLVVIRHMYGDEI